LATSCHNAIGIFRPRYISRFNNNNNNNNNKRICIVPVCRLTSEAPDGQFYSGAIQLELGLNA